MNKQQKLQLEAVVNAVVNEDLDAAKEAFHEYLRSKTQDLLLGEKEECDDEDMDDEDDKDVDEDLDKADKAVKKAKKDQKKDEDDQDEKKKVTESNETNMADPWQFHHILLNAKFSPPQRGDAAAQGGKLYKAQNGSTALWDESNFLLTITGVDGSNQRIKYLDQAHNPTLTPMQVFHALADAAKAAPRQQQQAVPQQGMQQ